MRDLYAVVNLAPAPMTMRDEYDGDRSAECRKRKCKYFSGLTSTCDYYLITKQRRAAICKPGDACTVCQSGKRYDAGGKEFNRIPNHKKEKGAQKNGND